jgi:hypothetical protein
VYVRELPDLLVQNYFMLNIEHNKSVEVVAELSEQQLFFLRGNAEALHFCSLIQRV